MVVHLLERSRQPASCGQGVAVVGAEPVPPLVVQVTGKIVAVTSVSTS